MLFQCGEKGQLPDTPALSVRPDLKPLRLAKAAPLETKQARILVTSSPILRAVNPQPDYDFVKFRFLEPTRSYLAIS